MHPLNVLLRMKIYRLNTQYKWPLFCIGSLVIGSAIGYFIGNRSDPSALGDRGVLSSGIQNHRRGAQLERQNEMALPAASPTNKERQNKRPLLDAQHGSNDNLRKRNLYAVIDEMLSLDKIDQLELQLLDKWAESDPRAAAEHLVNFLASDDVNSSKTLHSIVSKWAEIDTLQALAFAQQLKNERFSGIASGSVLGKVAESDPQLAITLFQQLPPSSQKASIDDIRRSWQGIDVAATAAWISKLPEGMVGGNQGGHIAGAWVRKDPIATAVWLNHLPAGDLRDDAVRVFAMSISSQDPEVADEWVNTITDAELRDDINRMITRK